MKAILLILAAVATILLSEAVFARGSGNCAYKAAASSNKLSVIKTFNITRDNDQRIPNLTKQQAVSAAGRLGLGVFITSDQAFDAFRKSSSNGEVFLNYLSDTSDNNYTYIQFYPGEKEYGVVFETSSLTVVATIEDGTVVCQEQ